MTRAVLTHHARARAAEMDIRTKEIKRSLREPELVYRSRTYGCMVAVAGLLAIPYTEGTDGTVVAITVLWRGADTRSQTDPRYLTEEPELQP